jgi:excisionase family DNA binding protein
MKTSFTVSEGAEYAGVSRDTIYTACERGELRHARIGGRRSIRIKSQWIDEWLERYVSQPTRATAGSMAAAVIVNRLDVARQEMEG